MHSLKKLTVVLVLIISTSPLFAQEKVKPEIAGKWHVKNIVYLNDEEALGTIEYTLSKQGVVKVNKTAKVEWEIPIGGHMIGIGKYKGNAIVFYRTKEIHSAIVDIQSHQLINDKIIYTGRGYIIPAVNNDSTGNFINLSIRTPKKSSDNKTKLLTIITLGEDGSFESKEISSVALNGNFIDLLATKEGNIFVASISNKSMIVEKFNSNATLENKLEVPLDFYRNIESMLNINYSKMCLDPYNNNTVIAGTRYVRNNKGRTISFCQFNFNEKKGVMLEDIPLEEKKSPYLTPQNILFTKDKTILFKEIQDNYYTSDHRQIVYESGAAVVSIYDKEQHNLHDIIIPKRLQSFTNHVVGLSCYLKDEKLYILSTEIISLGTLDNYCYVIDLNSGKLEKKKIGYNKPSASRVVSPLSTFWFPNECMVSHVFYMAALGSEKYETIFEKISYEDIDKMAAIN